MSDFRNLQYYISHNQVSPIAEEYYLEGYTLLRHCAAEAEAVLNRPFNATVSNPSGNSEREKSQLRSVIVDAAVRRFQCQRAYLRVHAALRWMNSRYAILQGRRPTVTHVPQLQAVDNQLRAEVAAITDEHVINTLQMQDSSQGKWLGEDPSLATIQHIANSQR
ncbi:hypothetical protein EJ05DRAFT_505173 [Pseudovirgaria hyperparasitica]|uniref:Uncharacterized protein n=1 Tax=Pseudovirgaria hyperparasitica TaxID=470096 RepID=A0A6A6VSH1_9PEZI|nr:uncharacterized protein EJ05DRAFT_505173 [Pseudovirgaria hyperparasitica]KAF2753542.1 hypothetical protein EJ05DRAFT_505173 [Pseudovirgaria hyperparasitica]